MMPSLPKVDKFKGDNQQSFSQWILMFEAQLTVLDTEENKKRETLLCLLESNAFTSAAQFIAGTPTANYTQLKAELTRLFSGDDYKRALETKMRTLNFTEQTNIPVFCNQLRLVVGELYGIIADSGIIEKIAINDVMSKLDPTIREPLKLLQLAGTCKLEVLLEMAKSKMIEGNVTNTTFHSSAFAGATTDTRLDRLEKMMENLVTNFNGGTVQREKVVCEECGKNNHTKNNCFRLKTCFLCNTRGHISRYCPKKPPSSGTECHGTILKPVKRIMISLELNNNAPHEFLYDPGSQYSMITKTAYEKLINKPPMLPTSMVGVSVQQVPFKLDGTVYIDCRFRDEHGEVFILPNEPFLISSAIESNIFGMHTEHRFVTINRDYSKSILSFTTHNGREINMRFYNEKKSSVVNSAHVYVHKTTVLQPQSISLVKSKLRNKQLNIVTR